MQIPGMNDFYSVQNAASDKDGLIECAVLPLRDMVLYPNMVTPLFVGRDRSLTALSTAQAQGETVIGVAQREPSQVDPQPADMFTIGTEMAMGRPMRMPDGGTSVLVQGRRRVEVVRVVQTSPYLRVKARPLTEPPVKSHKADGLRRAVLALFDKCVSLNPNLTEESYIYAMNIEDPGWLADLIASTLDLKLEDRQGLLEMLDPIQRLQRISVLLGHELDVLEIEEQINAQVQQEVNRGQREVYLREQMRAIQGELGEIDIFQQEVNELREKIDESNMPKEVQEKAAKELARLGMMPSMAPEVGIIRTYLDWLTELPWSKQTQDNLDIDNAAKVLDAEHFGLPKAKDRILEHIAVRKLAAEKMKSPILCFAGPPGTGKTSLGRSIAKALGREFVRVSLGGVRDEAEIRGHRRTYIGALPGRILQTMRRAGTVNPVFMLDEIDKLGHDFRGDPSSALLEVLDPEQNHAFSDHYLEVSYDLSKVMFITTANTLDPIPPALLDRLEVIEFSGYIEEEKLSIAHQFIIPRKLEETGLAGKAIKFEEDTLRAIIREYTYEAGVRNFEREIANVCRKLARKVAAGQKFNKRVTPDVLADFLGPAQFLQERLEDRDQVGLATGVAYTEGGGDVMVVEVMLLPGKGGITFTGQLGDVMQESAQTAHSYARSQAQQLNIKPSVFEKTDIHIHLPEGAIPKEGPSAGITLATALISALTKRPVSSKLAMTGEITLRGKVLPVGGIKEKVMAAYRAGLRRVILPERNRKDVVEIPKKIQGEMEIHYVKEMDEVLQLALAPAGRASKTATSKTKVARKPAAKPSPAPQASASGEVGGAATGG
jgi:ATP-dependent Lon protease